MGNASPRILTRRFLCYRVVLRFVALVGPPLVTISPELSASYDRDRRTTYTHATAQ